MVQAALGRRVGRPASESALLRQSGKVPGVGDLSRARELIRTVVGPRTELQGAEQGVKTLCLVHGCHCNACCDRIEKALRRVKGVRQAEVNLFKATATVEHDKDCPPQHLLNAVERIGYLASIADGSSSQLPNKARPSE